MNVTPMPGGMSLCSLNDANPADLARGTDLRAVGQVHRELDLGTDRLEVVRSDEDAARRQVLGEARVEVVIAAHRDVEVHGEASMPALVRAVLSRCGVDGSDGRFAVTTLLIVVNRFGLAVRPSLAWYEIHGHTLRERPDATRL